MAVPSLVGSTGCQRCDDGHKAKAGCHLRDRPHHHTTRSTERGAEVVFSAYCTAAPLPADEIRTMHARMAGRRPKTCGKCGQGGHNKTSCGRPSRYRGAKTYVRPARPAAAEPEVSPAVETAINGEDDYEVDGAQAAAILERLRPLAIRAMTTEYMLESLMISCYLQGLNEALSKGNDQPKPEGGP